MLAKIRAKKPFNGQRARLTVDGALPRVRVSVYAFVRDWVVRVRVGIRLEG